MPRVLGGKKSTYLLINGISVPRAVSLAPGLDLLPIGQTLGGRPYLSNLDLFDQQFVMLLLPWTNSQLRVCGNDERQVATRAWNSLWDVLLLSSIHASPMNCGLQSSCLFENFTEKSKFNVIHHRILEPAEDRLLTEDECQWLEMHFKNGQRLLAAHGFQTAVHCLATYHWHTMPRAQLALLWAGIEGLFSIDTELSFRVSLYAAKYLEPKDEKNQRDLFAAVKRLYGARSKAVHGGRMKGEPFDDVRSSVLLLNRLIKTSIEQNSLPDPDELTF